MRSRIRECIAQYNDRRSEGSEPLTQAEIGRIMGVSESLVSLWVSDQRAMKAETAFRLAELLGCEPRDLFTASDLHDVKQGTA